MVHVCQSRLFSVSRAETRAAKLEAILTAQKSKPNRLEDPDVESSNFLYSRPCWFQEAINRLERNKSLAERWVKLTLCLSTSRYLRKYSSRSPLRSIHHRNKEIRNKIITFMVSGCVRGEKNERVEKDDSIWSTECLKTGVSKRASNGDSKKNFFDCAEVKSIDACWVISQLCYIWFFRRRFFKKKNFFRKRMAKIFGIGFEPTENFHLTMIARLKPT